MQQLGDIGTYLEYVGERRGEVVVHRHDVAWLDESACQNVLGSAPLMHRQQIFLTQHIFDGLLHPHERLRSGIGVVGLHHGGELVVRHCVGSAVGEHVEEHIVRRQAVGVEARVFERFQTALDGDKVEFLNDTDLVHFEGQVFVLVKFNVGHDSIIINYELRTTSGRLLGEPFGSTKNPQYTKRKVNKKISRK